MSTLDDKQINESYFNASNFESLMRGIHFVVYWIALVNIYTGPRRLSARMKMALSALATALFVMSTIHNAAYWAYVRRAFIAYGQTEESIADALDSYPVWFTGITSVSDGNAVLADCVIIWRCWIVWGRQWSITIVPIICTMLTTAFSIIAIYSTVTSTSFGAVGVDYATALYSTSLATTIFCTVAIVFRILQVARGSATSDKSSNSLRVYRGVIEILVESSALYCIATLFALIAYIYSGPASEFASAFWTSVTGISPTLTIARVASGEARPDDSWAVSSRGEGSQMLSFMRFGSRRPAGLHSHSLSDEFEDEPVRLSSMREPYSDGESSGVVNRIGTEKSTIKVDEEIV